MENLGCDSCGMDMKVRLLAFLTGLMLACQWVGAAPAVTLTNLNRVYFLVDADPSAIPTNVVILSGSLTNWQKLTTNVLLVINPSVNYVPYKSGAETFADSWLFYTANGMRTDTNLFFGGTDAYIQRNAANLNFISPGYAYFSDATLNPIVTIGQGVVILQDNNIASANPIGSKAVIANNTYLATASQQQNSPAVSWTAQGWGTNSATSQSIVFGAYLLPESGADTPTAALYFDTSISNSTPQHAFHITPTMWDDSQVPEALVRVGATAPAVAAFNGGPGQTLQFQNNRDDAITASLQLSHRYKQGTDLYPHVHWAEVATTTAGTNIVWEMQYSWANPDAGIFSPYQTLLMTNHVTGTNWWHSMEAFPAISGSGVKVSSVFVFQLRRLANSATADNYDKSIAFIGVDFHFQVDSPGSDSLVDKHF